MRKNLKWGTLALICLLLAACARDVATPRQDWVYTPPIQQSNLACGRFEKSDNQKYTGPGCSWKAACEYRITTDIRICHVTKTGWPPGPVVFVTGAGEPYVLSTYNHHPGRNTVIRVDMNKPVTAADSSGGTFSPSQSADLIAQMKTGATIRLSGTEWPADPVNSEWSLDGFSAAYLFAQEWLSSSQDQSSAD